MKYTYKSRKPIEYAEELINSYLLEHSPKMLPPAGRFTYHQGVFLSGVEKIYLQNNNSAYDKYIKEWLSIVLNEDKSAKRVEGHFWLSLDSLDFRQAGILLFRLYQESKDKRYLDSIAELCESLLNFPVNEYGGFWHMKSEPNQMWLDGLYMVGPLCAQYCVVSGKREFGTLALQQAELMYENMHDAMNGLLFHGWDCSKEAQWADPQTGLSPEKWGRALGWFVVATLDILEFLSGKFDEAETVKKNVKSVLDSLLKYQRDDGFWYQVIDKPSEKGNWRESSCTCLIAYAMAKATRLGIGREEYTKSAKCAFEGIIDSLKQDKSGATILHGICAGTCIEEGTYEHYISCKTSENDLHGIGAFALMCAEMNLINL